MTRALPRVALQVWIVLFIVFFGAEIIHLEPGLRATTQVVYGLPLAAWAILRLRGPHDRLEWVGIGLLGTYAVVCLVSRDRTESLGTLALATAYASWFMLMRRSDAWGLRGPIVVAVATGLTLTLAFNTYLAISEKLGSLAAFGAAPLEGGLTFPWESVNALPALVLVTIPFLVWLGPGPIRPALSIVVGISAVVLLPISQGRAGWTGIAIAALVYALLLPAIGRLVTHVPPVWRAVVAAGMVVAGGLALLVISPRLASALGDSGRLLLWEQALHMFAGSPVLGSGPGVYSWVRMEFPPAGADLLAVRLLHNVPLLTLVEGGVALFAANAIALVAWVMAALRRARSWAACERVAFACLAGFGAASLLDDFSYLPAVIAVVLTVAAFLVPVTPSPPSVGWAAPALLGIAAIVALPSVVAVDIARNAAQSGRTAMADWAYAEAVAHFEEATSFHPESGGYWLGLGMAAAHAGDEARARMAYEHAIAAAPGDPRGYAAMARLGPPADAIGYLRLAADRTMDDPQDAIRLGLALVDRGEIDAATHAWARAVALRGEVLRVLPYASTGVSMRAVADEAILEIRAEPRPNANEDLTTIWDVALVLDELPDDAGTAWRAVDAARHGRLEIAQALADEAVAEAPWGARGHQAAAAVAGFACDADAERRELALERRSSGAFAEPDPKPRAQREFVYREASLGASQPPGARVELSIERWPWSLIDRPGCDQ